MQKEYAKHMRCGKTVESSWTGEVYKLIEDADVKNPVVKAVNVKNWKRYKLLKAWGGNQVGLTDHQRDEMHGYEEMLKLSDVRPNDMIRFVTARGTLKFEAKDLSRVRVNGELRQVVYMDPYHFAFVRGDVFHIFEFAEMCEASNIDVRLAA